jgi:uncharacterized protein (TIGR02246 family)
MPQDDSLRDQLVAFEQKYWNAIKDKDSTTAASLTDEPCVLVGAQGVSEIRRNALAQMFEGAPYTLQSFALDDIRVRSITDDVAVVAYKVKEDLIVEGKPVELEASNSSVWVRREGRWACAVHTESIAGDPFGRQ